ncbi:MAG: beta-propeller fold lactonase family protein [Pirellulales bacterium]|nr:beta-propeller fold lactonase family protein [Pirellulales bacterium]
MKLQRVLSLAVLLTVAGRVVIAARAAEQPAVQPAAASTDEPVGRAPDSALVTPVNQRVTPLGKQVELPDMRPQAIALSPDGTLLVTAGFTNELVVVDPASGEIRQRVKLPAGTITAENPGPVGAEVPVDEKGQVSYTGLVFSPAGDRIYLSNVNGDIKVFRVADNKVSAAFSIPLPPAKAPGRQEEIPAGLAMSADGARLFVCCNLSNRLTELDTGTGKVLRAWDVGVAPYGVALAGDKAFVSNWGGDRPTADMLTGPAGLGTRVRVDPVRHIANHGSVSVVDLSGKRGAAAIRTGLHPSGLALSPDGKLLAVANAGSDTISVIDTPSAKIVRTASTKENPAIPFGASPNALVFDDTGRRLYVCNGAMNCVALIEFEPAALELEGLLPVGWYPGAIAFDASRRALYVANIKGISTGRPNEKTGRTEFNTRQFHGSLSLLEIPADEALAETTKTVMRNCRAGAIAAAMQPARPDQPRRPMPERHGEPSVFEHVIYIIKENRTYDQVLGDVAEGNGDPELCIFGERVTPNQHRLARQFVLLDNTYCSGILSADGHQWTDSAITTDYMEKSFAGFPRSYPDGMSDEDIDALAYSPAGFLWDNALAHKKSLRVYGEFAITEAAWKDKTRQGAPAFLDFYRDFTERTGLIDIRSRPAIESLRPHLCTSTVGWEMNIPDVFRAAQFIKELKQFERQGRYPNLVMICLPNDHTSGTKEGAPTPAAQVADNDLALGQIVEAVSHSRFWKKTCIVAIEDDPQAGWDHVSGYRTTAYVISPYTKRGAVVHTQYNQTSLVKSIALMLGLPPMNLMDASATSLADCFVDQPDFAPYDAVPSQVPLDEMNPAPAAIREPLLRELAEASAGLPLEEIDRCPEELLNRILWHSQRGASAPFPSWASGVDEDD